jgi:soluble lytic murein transglycosylase-like protein
MVRRTAIGFAAAAVALGWLLPGAGQARAYEVRPGDTLWAISHRTGVPVDRIARDNRLADPNVILAGQRLVVEGEAAAAPAAPTPQPVNGPAARQLLQDAAREFGLNPRFVLAVSLWESGFNQAEVSGDGAVGLMQILPVTAAWAGPALLGRPVDVYRASDNARLGAALLRRYLDEFGDPRLALAAYYQGERATRAYGVYPSSRTYVDGIWALRNLLQAGRFAF